MADEEFFKESPEETPQETEAQEKIKLGDKEYSQEELDTLVKLGEIAKESEEKYNRPISKFWPEYSKAQEKIKELEGQLEEKQAEPTLETGQLDENIRQQALKQAKDLGIITRDDINSYIDSRIQGKELLDNIKKIQTEAEAEKRPVPNTDELLLYMQETGFKDPTKAYKDMFEEELESWKEGQLKKIKQPGLQTQTQGAAATKTPPEPEPVTKENLRERLKAALEGSKGLES